VFCFDTGEIFVITSGEYFTTIDDVMKESTCFMRCKEFLFTNCVLELSIVEFA